MNNYTLIVGRLGVYPRVRSTPWIGSTSRIGVAYLIKQLLREYTTLKGYHAFKVSVGSSPNIGSSVSNSASRRIHSEKRSPREALIKPFFRRYTSLNRMNK